jgi:YVTN family beta-propeller protein
MKRAVLVLALLLSAAAHASTLLVLNKLDSTLSFVDTATSKVISTIPTGEAPHEVQVSADGRMAIVTNYGTGPKPGSTLSVIDVAARKEIKRLQLQLIRPHGLYAVGNHIYITAEGSHVVARYDVAKGLIDATFATGGETSHMVLVTAGEKKLYTANMGSNNVSVLDFTASPTKPVVKLIPTGKGPEGLDFSPDHKQIWVADRADPSLSIIDTASDTVIRTVTTGTKVANRVKFTRDGKHVLVSDPASSDVVVLDGASGKIVKNIRTLREPEGILIAPDGHHAYVACASAKAVQIIDLDKLEVAGTIAVGKGPDGLGWAP